MEQRHDRLLARKRDVETGVALAHRIVQQAGQCIDADAQDVEVDEPVDQIEPLCARFRLVQRRRARALDAGADEAAKHAHGFSLAVRE